MLARLVLLFVHVLCSLAAVQALPGQIPNLLSENPRSLLPPEQAQKSDKHGVPQIVILLGPEFSPAVKTPFLTSAELEASALRLKPDQISVDTTTPLPTVLGSSVQLRYPPAMDQKTLDLLVRTIQWRAAHFQIKKVEALPGDSDLKSIQTFVRGGLLLKPVNNQVVDRYLRAAKDLSPENPRLELFDENGLPHAKKQPKRQADPKGDRQDSQQETYEKNLMSLKKARRQIEAKSDQLRSKIATLQHIYAQETDHKSQDSLREQVDESVRKLVEARLERDRFDIRILEQKLKQVKEMAKKRQANKEAAIQNRVNKVLAAGTR